MQCGRYASCERALTSTSTGSCSPRAASASSRQYVGRYTAGRPHDSASATLQERRSRHDWAAARPVGTGPLWGVLSDPGTVSEASGQDALGAVEAR